VAGTAEGSESLGQGPGHNRNRSRAYQAQEERLAFLYYGLWLILGDGGTLGAPLAERDEGRS
jgi:hypothetical protein